MSTPFPVTQWSLIFEHQKQTLMLDGEREALCELCDIYWKPVHSFLAVICPERNDIDDLTQGFFETVVVQHDLFANATPGKGMLRSYLRVAAKHYFLNILRSENSQRRGGENIDIQEFDDSLMADDETFVAADEAFDRQWARDLLTLCLDRLHAEHKQRRREDLSLALQSLLLEDSPEARVEVARDQGLTNTALRVCLHRYITRFRKIFREELQVTLFPDASLDEEMQWIRNVLNKPEADRMER